MEGFSGGTLRVRETLLSRKPRDYSLEVTLLTVAAILAVSTLAWQDGGALMPALAATWDGVLEKQEYWRLVTAVAVHGDMLHFFSNAILLAFFTYLLFGYFGFWVYPVWSLVLAGLTNYLSLLTYSPGVSLVGASGLVYWMAGFWLSMYLVVERSLSLRKRVLRVVGVGLVILVPSALQENVSYRTHAIGFALGVASALVYFQRNRDHIRAAEVIEIEDSFGYPEEFRPS